MSIMVPWSMEQLTMFHCHKIFFIHKIIFLCLILKSAEFHSEVYCFLFVTKHNVLKMSLHTIPGL